MEHKKIAVYVRVSTTGQDTASQEPDLKTWVRLHGRKRPVQWYRDRFTGTTMNRPGMRDLEEDIRAGRVETLLVWRLDRLGRTAAAKITFLDDLQNAGVRFVSLRDGVDTSSASGRLLRTILAGFTEYEREVISERIRAGIAKAKASGKRWGGKKPGNPYKLTPEKLKAMHELLRAGHKKAAVARQLGISRASVYRATGTSVSVPRQ
jgi:DNA invertase Pin-like site-specific DNA recombinase